MSDPSARRALSYSQIRLFRLCHRQFAFERSGEEADEPPATSEAGLIGQAVHRAMSRLGETGREDLARNALASFARMPSHAALIGPGLPAFDTLEELLQAGVAAHRSIDSQYTRVEYVTGAPSSDRTFWLLRVRIDRIDQLRDGTWQLVDWKTNRWENDEETDDQLDIAHVAMRQAYRAIGDAPVRAIAWNLRNPEASRERLLLPEDALATLASCEAIYRRIEALTEWEPNPGPHCRFCRWRSRCPDSLGLPE